METNLYESKDDYYTNSGDIYLIKIFHYIVSRKSITDVKISFNDYQDAISYFTSMGYISKTYRVVMSWPVFIVFLAHHRIIKSRVVGDEITKNSVYRVQDNYENFHFKRINSRINAIQKINEEKKQELKEVVKNVVEKQLKTK